MRLIAFGSAAHGNLSAANDFDLLVVEPEVESRYSEILRLQTGSAFVAQGRPRHGGRTELTLYSLSANAEWLA